MFEQLTRPGHRGTAIVLIMGLLCLAALSRLHPPPRHKPVLLMSGNKLWRVSREGVLLPGGPSPRHNLPIVSGVEEGEWSPYDTLRSLGLRHALGLVEEIEKIDPSWLDLISEIVVSDTGGIRIYLVDGTPVQLGTGDYSQKARQLWAVLIDVRRKMLKVKEIDLRLAEQAVVRVAR